MKKNPFASQLGEYFNTFLPEVHRSSENTISAYADAFAVFFQFLSEQRNLPHYRVTYKQLSIALFDDFIIWMKNDRGYSNSSVRQRMSAIAAFLKYASKREMTALTAYSSVKSTDIPKVVRTEFPYFTKDEMSVLMTLPDPKKCLGSRDLVLLSFLYDTGARAQNSAMFALAMYALVHLLKLSFAVKTAKAVRAAKPVKSPYPMK